MKIPTNQPEYKIANHKKFWTMESCLQGKKYPEWSTPEMEIVEPFAFLLETLKHFYFI